MMKRCKQCGVPQLPTNFRPYPHRKGRYTICRNCERINARARYLERKTSLTEEEREDLTKIYNLWDKQTELGFGPASRRRKETVMDIIDKMLSDTGELDAVPPALAKWLKEELTEDPNYYLDEVYEELRSTFKPVVGYDDDMMPIYDDTYSQLLEEILNRFYQYEEEYYDNN
jgi:hypothetical protein